MQTAQIENNGITSTAGERLAGTLAPPAESPMNWDEMYAKRTRRMKRSAIRELLKVTRRPEVISFAGGLPAAELFPIPQVKAAVDAVLQSLGGKSLQYGETEGVPELREWVARHFSRNGVQITADNVLITTGAQQALDLVGRVFLDESDRAVVENPTYLALLSAWRPYVGEFLAVPSDDHGMQVDALPKLLAKRPKLVYITPNFQNPQGTTLTRERRESLVALLREYNVALLEDNPYGELRFDGEALPHLLEIEGAKSGGIPNHVMYSGTFSKVLMPGLRVGWVIAAPEVIDKLGMAKQAADLHTSTLCQYAALELLRRGFLDEFVPLLCKSYGQRRDLMLSALEKHFGAKATWNRPEGGMFLLVTLPANYDTTKLLASALEQNVAYVPGEEFHMNGEGKNTMRLNFSNARPEQIQEGIRRLASVI
jgi:Transcriptional regulators containing a DNA-binding HTH domain and an aminotransferase domain (MocR family) and their eukaryotic orthologs